MKLYIKYMVSPRCKMVVRNELSKLGLDCVSINLGEVETKAAVTVEQRRQLKINLLKSGFELIEDKKAILVEKIKGVIIEMVHYMNELPDKKYSDYISNKLSLDYTYISNLFSEVYGVTIEHYIIANKIEKVKELLVYDELTLTEIAYKLHYSSVGHLSNQFRNVTGLTPSFFKRLRRKKS